MSSKNNESKQVLVVSPAPNTGRQKQTIIKPVSRRDFLRTAAVFTGGTALAGHNIKTHAAEMSRQAISG